MWNREYPKSSYRTLGSPDKTGCPVKTRLSDGQEMIFFKVCVPNSAFIVDLKFQYFYLLYLSTLNLHQWNCQQIISFHSSCPWIVQSMNSLDSVLCSCSIPGENNACEAFICNCDRNAAICFSKVPYNKEHKNLDKKKC